MTFWYWLGHSLSKIFAKIVCSYRVQNIEGLETGEGGVLIASNHVSFLDPPLIGIAYRTPIYYFARKTLFDNPIANFIFTRVNAIPVNQDKPEISSLKLVIRLLKEGKKVVIFPEGERTLDGKMKTEGEPGVGMIVAKANVPVLPVRLFGPEKALPRGSKKITPHPVTLVVGKPIEFSDLLNNEEMSTKERYQAISARIMSAIAALELTDNRGE
ncbi:MAG: 1-acyl-sn-glycerol-3-phosphate acyltransferase [Verrucomicrobiales bacterium]|jgi:1-acyl-sn-glycerol-3-phosphate acyltransferase|nr:1-acyl-sn-glycerol-3-phosphate acyltransferase [Verrucomicrobiales bacterium]MBP9224375.1 1-acyl-sn-glycerol-3-phosphate acyltransferase [Verrucomicrobiales bacterium]